MPLYAGTRSLEVSKKLLSSSLSLVNSVVFHLENICIGNVDVMADYCKEFQYDRFVRVYVAVKTDELEKSE